MDFKSSNMDPRELVMLFKSDLMLSPLSLDKHFDQISARDECELGRHIEQIKLK